MPSLSKTILGIDLAGSDRRDTGVCLLDMNLKSQTFVRKSNEEILKVVRDYRPCLVAIDAPLSLPKGRKSLKKRSKIHFRSCDKELFRLKIKFFPITLGPMRKLTERGIFFKKILEKNFKVEVIEVFPGATQDILGLPRWHKDYLGLRKGLERLGIRGIRKGASAHELDAATCAFTGWLYLKGWHNTLGEGEEGVIIVPHLEIFSKRWENKKIEK